MLATLGSAISKVGVWKLEPGKKGEVMKGGILSPDLVSVYAHA